MVENHEAGAAFRRRWVAVLLAVGLLAACQPNEGQPQVSSVGTSTTSAAPTSSTPTTSLLQGDLTLGPGPFLLTDPRIGLAGLSSYTATLNIEFDGTSEGQAHRWSSSYVMRHNADLPASVVTIVTSGDLPPRDPTLVAEADGSSYDVALNGSCRGEPIDPDFSAVESLEPAGLLDAILGADEAGQDMVEGIVADHYTFDERAVGLFEVASTNGEIWMASDGGYVVKYTRTTTGDTAYFGPGTEGTLEWEYSITAINQPVDTSLPTSCRVDAPTPGDATNLLNLPNWLSFDTPASVADLADFYRNQLETLGWTLELAPNPAVTAVLVFISGEQTMHIVIGPGDLGHTSTSLPIPRSRNVGIVAARPPATEARSSVPKHGLTPVVGSAGCELKIWRPTVLEVDHRITAGVDDLSRNRPIEKGRAALPF